MESEREVCIVKKFLCLVLILLCLAGCGAQEGKYVYALIYDGTCYISGGQPIPAEPAPEAYVGYIASEVPADEMPEQELQANFPSVGEPVALCGGKLHAIIDNEWAVFEPVGD